MCFFFFFEFSICFQYMKINDILIKFYGFFFLFSIVKFSKLNKKKKQIDMFPVLVSNLKAI